jgi:hypothetical protein
MQRITVTPAGGLEALSAVIDHGGAENNFIAPIAVHVANGEIMVALPAVSYISGLAIIGVKCPEP